MATNRLYRDKEHGMLGGVCAGIANRFDVDPTLVRVAVIAAAVLTVGTTLLLYLAAWIIMPASPDAPAMRPSPSQLSEEFRDAGGRVTEAGRILARSARQAADEISALQNRPVAGSPAGDEAAGAQAVSEDVLSSDAPSAGTSAAPEAPAAPSYPETQYPSSPPPAPPSSVATNGDEEQRSQA